MIPYEVTGGRNDIPYVTWFIILLSAGLFLSQVLQPSFDSYVYVLTVVPPIFSLTDLKDWLNAGASLFMYESFVHVITGLWFLWVFGSWVEKQFGHVVYFLIFLISGVGALLLEWQAEPSSRLAIISSSAAVSGIMGTFLASSFSTRVEAIVPRLKSLSSVPTWAWIWPVIWLLLQVGNNVFFVETINYDIELVLVLFDLAGFGIGLLSGLVLYKPLKNFYVWFDALD